MAVSILNTQILGLSAFTTAERDALVDMVAGNNIYNSTTKQVEVYDGFNWKAISPSISAGQIAFGDSNGNLTSSLNLLYDSANNKQTVKGTLEVAQISGAVTGYTTLTSSSVRTTSMPIGNYTEINSSGVGIYNSSHTLHKIIPSGDSSGNTFTATLPGKSGTFAMLEDIASSGGGDVIKDGTAVDNQVAVWTGNGSIEGTAGLTFDSNTNILTVTGHIVTPNVVDPASERKFKEDIKEVRYGLDTVNKLKPSEFKVKGETKTKFGFIVDEIEKIIPEAIFEVEDADDERGFHKTVEILHMVPMLVKAIQDLSEKVDSLEDKLFRRA